MDIRTGAVIVAAENAPEGEAFRPLNELGGMTVASRVVANFRRAGITDIVMVTGFRGEELERDLRYRGVTFLRNEDHTRTQMLDSVKMGLAYLKDRCDRVFVCPGDRPFFTDETLRTMSLLKGLVILPSCHGRAGHPVLLDAAAVPAVLAYEGEGGLKGAIWSLDQPPVFAEVEDEGVLAGVRDEGEAERMLEARKADEIYCAVKVQLVADKPFFGPGTVTLFKQIDRLGSVREACAKTGISYSKGWSMIAQAEKVTGTRLILRQTGGRNGGGAGITDRCRDIIDRYERLQQAVAEYARMSYGEYFGDAGFG